MDPRQPASSPFHDRLEPGRVYDASSLTSGDIAMFHAVTLRPLEEMLVPELPRRG
ncbi:hypothetical protein ACH0CA_06315 [Kytococcus sedentarius]|uniref:hypothetical protein n=1 Tax=Kytococcus sedentarius TaxID=1276 RepID=UPI00387A12F3